MPAATAGLPASPAPASVTPSEVSEALRRANLGTLNPGQQADFRLGLQAIAVLAARLPREVPLALPFGFDFRPDLHAPAPAPRLPAPAARSRSAPPPGAKVKPRAKAKLPAKPPARPPARPPAKAKAKTKPAAKARRR